jgi:putative toxin-antitoxin system antitoxin component (TIGR02293 family)
MREQRLDGRAVEAELAEQRVELADRRAELRIVLARPRPDREEQRVLERKPAGFADELREEAGQAGDYVHSGTGCYRIDTCAVWHYVECQMDTNASEPRDIARFREVHQSGAAGPHAYTVLLGLDYYDLPSVLKAVEKGFPWKTFERLVDNMGLPAEQIASLIGIPRRTLARRKVEKRFQPDESDRLLRVARVFSKALELFSYRRSGAASWLTHLQRALGRIPLELVRSEIGAREVENVIGAISDGMFL